MVRWPSVLELLEMKFFSSFTHPHVLPSPLFFDIHEIKKVCSVLHPGNMDGDLYCQSLKEYKGTNINRIKEGQTTHSLYIPSPLKHFVKL